MSYKDFEAKSIDQAITLASEELNIPTTQIKYDVISHGATGIFGLVGTKKAKIRVALPEEPLAAQDAINVDEILGTTTEVDTESSAKPEYALKPKPAADIDIDIDQIESAIEAGRLVLQKIADTISEDTQIEILRQDALRYMFSIKGGNSAILIGKRGQTLEAMQYLVDKIVNKNTDSRVYVQVDVEGYLETRKANLIAMANKLSEKAKRTGKPTTIGQMNGHDRRIIHLALKNDRGVRTQSKGDGYYRKLVILPRNRNPRRRNAQPKADG